MAPRSLSLVCAAAIVAGCGGEVDPSAQPPAFSYPLDATLRLSDVQSKGTHNSYHVETPGNTLPDWKYTMPPLDVQLARDGVRNFELDVHRTGDDEPIAVHHLTYLDETTTCALFTDCLKVLKAWSDTHPAHQPLYVQMELKGGVTDKNAEAFFARLHAEVLSVWPRERLLTPDDVKGDAATLRDAVATRGWPTLGKLRQKLFFGFNDRGPLRDVYTHGGRDLDGRLVFVESKPSDPFAGIAISNDPTNTAEIGAALAAGMLVRTFGTGLDAPPEKNALALASGAHFISTDYPAQAPDATRTLTIPGGTPSRCNPKTAPPDCRPEDIEDPAFMR